MAFETLSKTLSRTLIQTGDMNALAEAARLLNQNRELLKGVLPVALMANVRHVAQKNQSLSIAVTSHATATKLYQHQQRLLSHFAANSMYFKEIRVFVQPNANDIAKSPKKPILPREAGPALDALIDKTENAPLKTSLLRLRQHVDR